MRTAFAAILALISTLCFSQRKAEIDPGIKKASAWTYDIGAFANKAKDRVCLIADGTDDVKGYILDKDYAVLKQFGFDKLSNVGIVTGGFFTGTTVHFFVAKDKDDDQLTHFTYDTATGKDYHQLLDLDAKKEMFIEALSLGDQFLYITVKKKEDKICVYRFDGQAEYKKMEFAYQASLMQYESLLDALSHSGGLSRNSEVTYVNGEQTPDVEKASKYCKLYYRNDSLLITIDREKNRTWVLTLDLANEKITGRTLFRAFDGCGASFQTSSFLLDNNLYAITCCHDALYLGIQDFYTGEMLKSYSAKSNEEINFKTTRVMQEGSRSGDSKEETTKKLLRQMTNGRAVITAAHTNSSTVVLTIGSYKEMQSGGGGMWMPGGGGGGGAPMYVGGHGGSWTQSTRFKTILRPADHSVSTGVVPRPLEDRIDALTDGIKIPKNSEGIYQLENGLSYYYFDKSKLKIVVVPM